VGLPAGDQVLVVARAKVPVPGFAARREMGYPPGLVGMDVLRGTVLALDADRAGLVTWQVDGPR
jgi:hypothetical protein